MESLRRAQQLAQLIARRMREDPDPDDHHAGEEEDEGLEETSSEVGSGYEVGSGSGDPQEGDEADDGSSVAARVEEVRRQSGGRCSCVR